MDRIKRSKLIYNLIDNELKKLYTFDPTRYYLSSHIRNLFFFDHMNFYLLQAFPI